MKLCIRAHDLGVKGTENILGRITGLGIDGVQMVCYKACPDIPYVPGGITKQQAAEIGRAFRAQGKEICMVGAYFNPVHSDRAKAARCESIFADYLACCREMGCNFVGSETGSYSDEPWVYHPKNRTPEALRASAESFARLCAVAEANGSTVAVEGAAGHVCWEPRALQTMREMLGRPTKVIFDLYNYMDAENQERYLSILEEGLALFSGDILLFHMKDCRLVPGDKPKQVPFGTGDLNLPEILARIKAADKNAILTLEGTTGDDIPFAVETIKTIWERV